MIIETEKNGILDLSDVKMVMRNYLIQEKKFMLIFGLKSGGTAGWAFGTEKERDAAYNKVRVLMDAERVE